MIRKDLDYLTQPIISIYNAIELELLAEIGSRFDTYDTVGGSLEWQVKQLEQLGSLNNDAVKIMARYSQSSEAAIRKMLIDAGYANIDLAALTQAFTLGVIQADPAKIMESPTLKAVLELSYKELDKTYKLIDTKAIESTKQAYMDVINRSYIEVSSGVYDYNTSVKRALQRMAAQGITGATYKRGDTIVNYSLEGTVRRDTLTAVHQLANKASFDTCNELGAEYVETSSHVGARVSNKNPIANHAGWQGKVFKIHGFDSEHGNLKNNTGYPGDIEGLGGVNCRHRLFPFFPGISTPNPVHYDPVESERIYRLTQEQRAKERKIRQTQKQIAVAKAAGDDITAKELTAKLKYQYADIKKFCEDNKLTRAPEREQIYTL